MEKQRFIEELIKTAQETIWKNELAMSYNEKYGGNDETKRKACEEAIKKDNEYISFLKENL